MKLRRPWAAAIRREGAFPARTPKKTFCISWCSFPVHWDIEDVPFLKCCKGGWEDMAWNRSSMACSPTRLVHHLMKWSLKTSLCSWWRMLGVIAKKMSVWGRSAQKGEYISQRPSKLNLTGSSLSLQPCRVLLMDSSVRRGDFLYSPCSAHQTVHFRHQFSLQHAIRHCSG